MVKKGILIASIIALFSAPTLLVAEGNATAKDSNKTVAAENKAKSDSKIEAAKALLEEMNLEKVYKSAVENSTKRLVDANPKFKKIEDKIKAFYEKAIGWKVMKNDLAKLYAKYYTTEELKDITEFYKTKTGKKVLSTMGNLTYEGQMLTRKRLMPHMDELKKMLDEAAKDQPKKSTKKADKKEEQAKK
jgi:hypothetical protein